MLSLLFCRKHVASTALSQRSFELSNTRCSGCMEEGAIGTPTQVARSSGRNKEINSYDERSPLVENNGLVGQEVARYDIQAGG